MMMRSVFRPLQERWDKEKLGVEMRTNKDNVVNVGSAICSLQTTATFFAASKEPSKR